MPNGLLSTGSSPVKKIFSKLHVCACTFVHAFVCIYDVHVQVHVHAMICMHMELTRHTYTCSTCSVLISSADIHTCTCMCGHMMCQSQ